VSKSVTFGAFMAMEEKAAREARFGDDRGGLEMDD
jgi:hypothetical protein